MPIDTMKQETNINGLDGWEGNTRCIGDYRWLKEHEILTALSLKWWKVAAKCIMDWTSDA